MFARIFVIFAAIAVVPTAIWCYSTGAPADACGNLTPQHHVAPQSSVAPYILEVSKDSIRAGDSVELTLRGQKPSNTFKGFLVQARVGDVPVGQFEIDPTYKYAQVLSCGNGNNNAATHKKIFGSVKSVKLSWKAPPGLTGDVKFVATVAQNGAIFWVAQVQKLIKVE